MSAKTAPAVQTAPAVPPVPAAAPAVQAAPTPAIQSPASPTPAPAGKAAAARVAPLLTKATAAVPMPETAGKRGRGSNSLYPFDTLAVGESFGVQNKTAKNLASIVSGANKRFQVEAKDAQGHPIFKTTEVKHPDGSTTRVPTLEKEMVPGKVFVVADMDPKSDPDGASVRVWRKQ